MSKVPASRQPNNAQLNEAEQWILSIPAETAALIEAGWNAAIAAPGDFAADFYANLFKAAPVVVGLFPGDMTEQQGRLTHTLGEAVALVHTPAHLMLLLRASGVRHHHYDVKPAYFSSMRNVLIDTIATRAGKTFTAEHQQAWEEFFDNMSVVMLHGMSSAAR